MPCNHYRCRIRWAAGIATVFAAVAAPRATHASDLISVQPLTERILLLHFDDGHVEHHKRAAPRSEEKVSVDPLNITAAMRPATYSVLSTDDPAYRTPQTLRGSVWRKTKGTEYAWFTDRWENGRAVNDRPDHADEHWIYLTLPAPIKPGKTYTVRTGSLAKNGGEWKLTYDLAHSRSEAVHVNTIGYVPDAPTKFAYVYHWMGEGGSLDLTPYKNRPFYLINQKNGKKAFTGQVRFRRAKDAQETFHKSDSPPNGNFLGADVWECDFSAFKTPGTYVAAVEGIGCSWPFKVEADVYRTAFQTVARGLYHNRSGIALIKPYTEFERPAPHNPKRTQGFAGKLRYTRVRWPEWGSEGGDAKKLMAESPGALDDTWGWYQDAGDWDSYYTHLRIAQELLLVYDMGPDKFRDGELNIPESGNGVPDILDEAAWLPRFCRRQRAELMAKGWGTGGVSLKVSGDAFGTDEGTLPNGTKVGRGSWEDTDRIWMVAGEDPWSTYRYAGAAACLAHAYQTAGVTRDGEGINWAKEAREAYAWAQKNTRPGDEQAMGSSLRHPRAYAAAALFRLTGDTAYNEQFAKDTAEIKPDTLLWEDEKYGPFIYALNGKGNAELLSRMRAAIVHTADESLVNTLQKRALRWGGNFFMPMLIGQQTTPLVLEGAVAYCLTKESDPVRARGYRAGLYTTCDYFLGTNSLNQTWVTGLGPRYPTEIFHMDAWYNGKNTVHSGLIPYGPWRKEKEQGAGPWDSDWANKTLYPAIDAWPGNERWFSNRCSPLTSEFTVHQNLGPAAALFGFLCAERAPVTDAVPKEKQQKR